MSASWKRYARRGYWQTDYCRRKSRKCPAIPRTRKITIQLQISPRGDGYRFDTRSAILVLEAGRVGKFQRIVPGVIPFKPRLTR
jgi:hypothetical protein